MHAQHINFIKIASIIKTHGYRGDIVLKQDNNISFSLFDKCLKEGNAIFISKDGIPVPFFISNGGIDFIDEQTIQLKLDELDDLEMAKDFINDEVYLTADCIEQQPHSEQLTSGWIGFEVSDEKYGFIGTIVDFDEDVPENPLIIIENRGKELMIPINGDLISSIDMEKKEIHTNLPDGYLDLYF
ncbi:MAG: hypothetical protein ABFS35_06000 [Bacteroidota bacterium]